MDYRKLRQVILFQVKNIRLLRILCYPFMNKKALTIRKNFAHSDGPLYLRGLKKTKTGKRCFIIGNGPSLTADDLEKLKDEDTFASNRIYCMFEKTKWRPTYYFCSDPGVFRMHFFDILNVDAKNIFLLYDFKSLIEKHIKNKLIHYFCAYTKFKINRYNSDKPHIKEDISDYFCSAYTVTFYAINLAIYMGYSEIYLLGIDHNYSVKVSSNGKVYRDETVKDYFDGLEKTGITAMNYEGMTAAYEAAEEYCSKHGITLCNATRGGHLEVFERVDFDKLLS